MKRFYKFVTLFLPFISACCTANSNLSLDFASAEMTQYAVQVSVDHKDGQMAASGFALDQDHLLTAGHFCAIVRARLGQKDPPISFRTRNLNGAWIKSGMILRVEWVSEVESNDFCILYSPNHKITALPVTVEKVTIGRKVMTVGNPLNVFPVRSYGEVVTPIVDDSGKSVAFLATMAVQRGNSGGLVVNEDGMLIGMVSGYMRKNPKISIVSRMTEICEEIKKSTRLVCTYGEQ